MEGLNTMTIPSHQIIHIQDAAPPKPPEGSPCNGCGVCCLSAPCPLGMVLSGRRTGTCIALRWDDGSQIYRCGAISEPQAVLRDRLPGLLHPLASALAPLLAGAARRWVAAGSGCDSSLEVGELARSSGTTEQKGKKTTVGQ